MYFTSVIFFILLPLKSFAAPSAIYQRSPIYRNGFDAKSQYAPCRPVEVQNRRQDVKYFGQRCQGTFAVEEYRNIRYAAESPLTKAGLTTWTYPAGSIVDTIFPTAFCTQLRGLPYNLTYEHMRDIEEPSCRLDDGLEIGYPIPEDCLTLSVYRPADLPRDMSGLIAPWARNSTHKRGLLPVTLIVDESGPSEHLRKRGRSGKNRDEEELDQLDELDDGINLSHLQKRLDANAAFIVARDIQERGTGRIIVLANYGMIDKEARSVIHGTLKAGIRDLVAKGETATAETCRTKEEFQRLSRLVRQRNRIEKGTEAIEWPIYLSARSRDHTKILTQWIKRNIRSFGGDPAWLQEVIVMPEGALWRTTTEPEWKGRRMVNEAELKKQEDAWAVQQADAMLRSNMLANFDI